MNFRVIVDLSCLTRVALIQQDEVEADQGYNLLMLDISATRQRRNKNAIMASTEPRWRPKGKPPNVFGMGLELCDVFINRVWLN